MMAAIAIEKIGLQQYPKCSRCGGLMTLQKFYSLSEVFWGWKCLLCGEIIDPVILENRQRWREDMTKHKGKVNRKRKSIREQYL
jgi:hypothetical protein